MKIDKVKLVAFANGELRGTEAAELEAALRKDPEAAAYVEQVKALAKRARADLGGEPLPGGSGSDKILREIARRQGKRPSDKQIWLQAATVGVVVVLLLALVPLKQKFGGQFANFMGMGGRLDHSTDTTPEEEIREKGPKPKDDPHAIERDFEALNARKAVSLEAAHCHFRLPAPASIDRVPKETLAGEFHRVFLLTDSGTELSVSVGSQPQPLVREIGVEELERKDAYSLFRRLQDELTQTYYRVPAESRTPFCWVRVALDGKLSAAAKTLAETPLGAFARSVAESMELK